MTRIVPAILALTLAMALAGPALAQGAPPQAGFQIVTRDPSTLEIRFRNMPLKGVHADAQQNALALDFLGAVDGSAFDRLSAIAPDWVSMAFANYDSGVIRASRPVTFLTRNESDGFSLRMVANGPAPMVAAPPGPVALRGPYDNAPPPQQPMMGPPPPPAPNLFARYNANGALRAYDDLELAVNRDSSFWRDAYARAAAQSDSEFAVSSEYQSFHSGDQIIASTAHLKLGLGNGISIVGDVNDTDAQGVRVRQPGGLFATNTHTNLISGALGLGWDLWRDGGMTLQALQGNHVTGVKFTGYDGSPSGFWQLDVAWHDPMMTTPEAIAFRAFTDHVSLGGAWDLGWGFWASMEGHGANYGVRGDAQVAKMAGWAGGLRWQLPMGPVTAGLAYNGRGDYLTNNDSFTGTAPSPFVPLSLRNRETHAITGSLSSLLAGNGLWLDLYGGWITDRYASDGGIYGGQIRFRPATGLDIALGARHSNVSIMQGQIGGDTRAGITFTLGFDGPSFDYF